MKYIKLIITIVAIALPSYKALNFSNLVSRISAIIFIFSGVLVLNAFYIHSIGSGVGIYSGLFHLTIISSLLDAFFLLLVALMLMSWPLVKASKFNLVITLITLLKDGSSSLKTSFLSPPQIGSSLFLHFALAVHRLSINTLRCFAESATSLRRQTFGHLRKAKWEKAREIIHSIWLLCKQLLLYSLNFLALIIFISFIILILFYFIFLNSDLDFHPSFMDGVCSYCGYYFCNELHCCDTIPHIFVDCEVIEPYNYLEYIILIFRYYSYILLEKVYSIFNFYSFSLLCTQLLEYLNVQINIITNIINTTLLYINLILAYTLILLQGLHNFLYTVYDVTTNIFSICLSVFEILHFHLSTLCVLIDYIWSMVVNSALPAFSLTPKWEWIVDVLASLPSLALLLSLWIEVNTPLNLEFLPILSTNILQFTFSMYDFFLTYLFSFALSDNSQILQILLYYLIIKSIFKFRILYRLIINRLINYCKNFILILLNKIKLSLWQLLVSKFPSDKNNLQLTKFNSLRKKGSTPPYGNVSEIAVQHPIHDPHSGSSHQPLHSPFPPQSGKGEGVVGKGGRVDAKLKEGCGGVERSISNRLSILLFNWNWKVYCQKIRVLISKLKPKFWNFKYIVFAFLISIIIILSFFFENNFQYFFINMTLCASQPLYFICRLILIKYLKSLYFFAMIPLGISNDNSDEESIYLNSKPQEFANFNNLNTQERLAYITNLMKIKGLTGHPFLIDHFNDSLLKNTSGSKEEVDNFLNENLNTILNDKRKSQLNKHGIIRVRPLLLNNSNNSAFPNVLPYKSDNSFDFEWQDQLESMREAQKLTEEDSISDNKNK